MLTTSLAGSYDMIEDSSVSIPAERLIREVFRARYAQHKPYYELLNGAAVQKPLPTRLHSILQFVLAVLLKELGFKSRPELTLAIDETWEPTPDVCGILGPEEDPYPTQAIAVAIEVLSPDDRFTRVVQKCRKYAEWGVLDILVYDPVDREVWYWDPVTGGLIESRDRFKFHSLPVQIVHEEVFRRLDDELREH